MARAGIAQPKRARTRARAGLDELVRVVVPFSPPDARDPARATQGRFMSTKLITDAETKSQTTLTDDQIVTDREIGRRSMLTAIGATVLGATANALSGCGPREVMVGPPPPPSSGGVVVVA